MKGLFRKWRAGDSERKIEAIDLSPVMVDMHSHLLPGIDDGAENLEDSIQLILHLQHLGYRKLITTPHIFWDMYRNTPEIITEKLALLRGELSARGIDVELEAAAEYYCDEYFEKQLESGNLLTFGKNYVLFEISFAAENANLGRAIFNMRLSGYNPILAHPERYEYWHGSLSHYEKMLDKDVLLQINISSLTGQYGPSTKRIAERLIDAGMVSFIGTDCHHMGHVQLVNTARTIPALKKLLDSGQLLNAHLMQSV